MNFQETLDEIESAMPERVQASSEIPAILLAGHHPSLSQHVRSNI